MTSTDTTAGAAYPVFAALRRRWQRWLDRRIPPASTVTLNQPVHRLVPGQPDGQLQGVNLPLREALESLTLNLANFLKPKERLVDWIPELQIQPRRFVLIYLPFDVSHHEYVQKDLNLAINKNLLSHAKNL